MCKCCNCTWKETNLKVGRFWYQGETYQISRSRYIDLTKDLVGLNYASLNSGKFQFWVPLLFRCMLLYLSGVSFNCYCSNNCFSSVLLLQILADLSVCANFWSPSFTVLFVYTFYIHTLRSNVGCLHKKAFQLPRITMWQLCPDAKPVCYFWSVQCHSPVPSHEGTQGINWKERDVLDNVWLLSINIRGVL